MIDPQTLIGLHIAEAIRLLSEQNVSYGYIYMDRRANRRETDYSQPDKYNLQIDQNDVVMRARIG